MLQILWTYRNVDSHESEGHATVSIAEIGTINASYLASGDCRLAQTYRRYRGGG